MDESSRNLSYIQESPSFGLLLLRRLQDLSLKESSLPCSPSVSSVSELMVWSSLGPSGNNLNGAVPQIPRWMITLLTEGPFDREGEDTYRIIEELKSYNHQMKYVEEAISMDGYIGKILGILYHSKQPSHTSRVLYQPSDPKSPEEWRI